jgi:hypothetical protein
MPLGSEVDELSSIDEEEFRMSRVSGCERVNVVANE